MEDIVPAVYTIEQLRENLGNIVTQVQMTRDPVFITQDGWAPVIMMDADEYFTMEQAYMELKRIFVDSIPGVALPEVSREGQSTAAIDNTTVNIESPLNHFLYPTTSEAVRNGTYYENIGDNENPLEAQNEIRNDNEV
ncbi:MAG: type II toxin-antitoxin system Phd/YefM family antitoxin [Eggerthellaceae bacterium]|nr:type II toxin-antitoxin system Phd/YefM family antitoxin [Eggerthellaceae bacterium]